MNNLNGTHHDGSESCDSTPAHREGPGATDSPYFRQVFQSYTVLVPIYFILLSNLYFQKFREGSFKKNFNCCKSLHINMYVDEKKIFMFVRIVVLKFGSLSDLTANNINVSTLCGKQD